MKNYSLSMYWDARIADAKTKDSRILLTVNIQGIQQFRITLKIRSTKADFEKALSSSRTVSDTIKELRTSMNDYLSKADAIISRFSSIDKEMFVRLFKAESDIFTPSKTDVFYFFELKMAECYADSRKGTYDYYKQCRDNVRKFNPNMSIEDINPFMIKKYQLYLKGLGNSSSTIALRLRALRIILNSAAKLGFTIIKENPFNDFATGSKTKSKSVLYPEQLKALWNYEAVGIREKRAKATFFFLYLSNGMNQKDMAYLKWSDFKGDTFSFIREKTKYTKSSVTEIVVDYNDELKKIVAEWGNKSKTGYVFPMFNNCKDAIHMENTRVRYKRTCNKALSKIGVKLGFEVHLSLNLARHSFATMHKLLGTPVSFISDAMGHSDSSMTEHYLKSLPDENRKEMSKKLMSFV